MDAETLYRYENTADQIFLCKFRVVRTTPKGKWIDHYGKEKFVITAATKRFAYETLGLARESFIARKLRQKRLLQAQLDNTISALLHAQKYCGDELLAPREQVLILANLPAFSFIKEPS